MKVKTICVAVAIIAAVSAIAPANGQQIGFTVGIAPANSPVHPLVSPPIGSFAVSPTFTPPVISGFAATSHFQPYFQPYFQPGYLTPQPWPFADPPVPVLPNRGVVVVAPGSTVYAPGATVVTGGNNVILMNNIAVPNIAIAPGHGYNNPQATPGNHGNHGNQGNQGRVPDAGTPRSQVIIQFGSPLVSILTMNGETMHFNGGITVSLQNGFVVRP